MKKINKDTREESKRGGWLKWIGIAFIGLMFMASLVIGASTESSDTTTTDNETEEVSSEVEESVQTEESLAEEREAKEEEERLAKEEEERLAKEEEERLAKEKEEAERLEQESIEAEEEWQEELDNARTDVTYDNLMRTPDDYFGEVVQYSGTVIQTITSDDIVQQRVALYDDYDQIVLIEYPSDLPEVRLLDDDYITFTGVSFGTVTYETVLGSTLEIPSILVERVGLE